MTKDRREDTNHEIGALAPLRLATVFGVGMLVGVLQMPACEDSAGGPPAECTTCDAGEDAYGCEILGATEVVCGLTEFDAENECDNLSGTFTGLKTTCSGQTGGGETGASGWDPGSNVYWDGSRRSYIIDATFWSDLLAEPDQLLFDSARLVKQSDGRWEFENIRSGDFAHEIGLQDGDEPDTLNGYDVDTIQNMWDTYVALDAAGATSFTLKVKRDSLSGKTSYTLSYIVE